MQTQLTKQMKQDWLDALKSGKYIQGIEKLKCSIDGTTKHCCLGVLAEIIPDLSPLIISTSRYESESINSIIYNKIRCVIPNTRILIQVNDSRCDGKYTAIIPLIEELLTID